MTGKEEISKWFDYGVKQGCTHLIVVTDTFDYENFAVYVLPNQNVKEIERNYSNREKMLKIMEVYNLKMDKEKQLNEYRSFNY